MSKQSSPKTHFASRSRISFYQLVIGISIAILAGFLAPEFHQRLTLVFSGIAITIALALWSAVRQTGAAIAEAIGLGDKMLYDEELWPCMIAIAQKSLEVRDVKKSLIYDSQQEALIQELKSCQAALSSLTYGKFDHDERGRIAAMVRAFRKANHIQAVSFGNFVSWWKKGLIKEDYMKANRDAVTRGASVDRIFVISEEDSVQVREIIESQLEAGIVVRIFHAKVKSSPEVSRILTETCNFAIFDDELVSVETRLGTVVKGFLSNRDADVREFKEKWDVLRVNSSVVSSIEEFDKLDVLDDTAI